MSSSTLPPVISAVVPLAQHAWKRFRSTVSRGLESSDSRSVPDDWNQAARNRDELERENEDSAAPSPEPDEVTGMLRRWSALSQAESPFSLPSPWRTTLFYGGPGAHPAKRFVASAPRWSSVAGDVPPPGRDGDAA